MHSTYEFMARPKKEPTKQVRFKVDLAEMLNLIALVNKKPIAEITDELFRPVIERERAKVVEALRPKSGHR